MKLSVVEAVCLGVIFFQPLTLLGDDTDVARTLGGMKLVLRSASFSPTGSLLLTTSSDLVAQVWDVSSGKELRQLERLGRRTGRSRDLVPIEIAAMSRDERWVATATCSSSFGFGEGNSSYNSIALWNIHETNDRVREVESKSLEGHTSYITRLTFSPDSRYLLSMSNDETGRWWNVQTGKQLFQFDGISASAECSALSADGTRFMAATAGNRDAIVVWDTRNGKKLTTIESGEETIVCAMFTPDASRIVAGCSTRVSEVEGPKRKSVLVLWDAKTGRMERKYGALDANVKSIALTPKGDTLIANFWLNTKLLLWDVESGRRIRELEHGGYIDSLELSDDGKRLLCGWSKEVRAPTQPIEIRRVLSLWNLETGEEIKQYRSDKRIAPFIPKRHDFFIVLEKPSLVDGDTGEVIREFE